MKKLVFSLLAIFTLVFTSCSSDDDNNNNSTTVEGTWKLTAWSVEDAIDINNDGTANTNLLTEMNCYNNENLVFSGSNVVTYVGDSYADITFDIDASTNAYTYTVDCVSESQVDPATYTRNGSVLVITFDDDEGEEDSLVATINGNTISFVVEDGYYAEENSASGSVFVEQDLTYVFTKQ